MIGNYSKIAISQFLKHKLQALLNIVGFAIGLSCCLIVVLFVVQELSYDRHYQNADRIYRVGRVMQGGNESRGNSILAAPLLENDFSEIERAVGFADIGRPVVLSRDELAFQESGIDFAEPGFFGMFDFAWLEGDASSAFSRPMSIVLTKSLAEKYFGGDSALGKTLLAENRYTLQVSGVIEDLPANTQFESEAIASMDVLREMYAFNGFNVDVWNFALVDTFVLLRGGTNIASVASRFPAFVSRHVPAGGTQIIGLYATPLVRLHAVDDAGGPLGFSGKLLISSAIGLCILLIAAINFVNLSTAHASWRMLEIGLRKSLGASRRQLIQQFLGEACLLTMFAMLLAFGIVELVLPAVNGALNLELSLAAFQQPDAMLALSAGTLVLGVLAGSYPALFLSGFCPSHVLRNRRIADRSGIWLRKFLVVTQFSLAIVLIISSAVMMLQMRLFRSLDMGFGSGQVLEFTLPSTESFDVNTQWVRFKSRLLEHPGVLAATHALSSPLLPATLEVNLTREGTDETHELVMVWHEADFFATYRIDLLAGRYFSTDISQDRARQEPPAGELTAGNLILNETAARQFGWTPEQAIGQQVSMSGNRLYAIVGVVRDTIPSARDVSPGVFFMMPATFNYSFFGGGQASLLLSGADLPEVTEHVESVWKEFAPNEPLLYQFMDDQIAALYHQERIQSRFFSFSALMAILIACFGLLGLAVFNAECRRKEIGIRKVAGGSVWQIVLLLTNDFSRLVLISNVIAWPVAYVAMQRWLENFAYRIDLTPLIFVGSGLIALCVAWVTVGGTAAKAASQKPVLALRYE